MILAAGRGERMRPFTDHTPKPLVGVANKTLLDFHLEKLAQSDINQIVINTSWLAEKIQRHIEQSRFSALDIKISHEVTPLETAGAVIRALPLLGNETFLLISADIWSEIDYQAFIERSCIGADLCLVKNPEHHKQGDFSLHGNVLTKASVQSYTYSGIGLFNPGLFRHPDLIKQKVLPLRDIINRAIESNQATGHVYKGKWFDVGTSERLFELNQFLQSPHP